MGVNQAVMKAISALFLDYVRRIMIGRVSKSISHIVAVPFFGRLFLTARDFLHNLDGPTTESRDDE